MSRQPTADDFRVNKEIKNKPSKGKTKFVSENNEVSPPKVTIVHYDKHGQICEIKEAVAFSMRIDGKKEIIYKILLSSGTPVDISNARLPKTRQLEAVTEEVFSLYMQYLLRRQFHDYEKTVRAQHKAV
jgi:hypothetical protein